MAAYRDDPGGVFASDVHRRTLAHLGNDPISVEDLLVRMGPDVGTDFEDEDELGEVLEDLEADGHASRLKDGWRLAKKGLDALNGPNGNEED